MDADAQNTAHQRERLLTPADVDTLLREAGSPLLLNLRGRNLQGISLPRVFLQGAHLEGANFLGAGLEKANFREAHLEGAHLEGADLREAYLEGAYLEGADLREAHLEGAHLEGADLREAHLEGAHLEGTRLEKTNLRNAHLEGAHLDGVDLRSAYLEGGHLEGASLRGANLLGANLLGANLLGAHLEGASLLGAHLEGANLEGVSLEGADVVTSQSFERILRDMGFFVDAHIGRIVSATKAPVSLRLRLVEEPLMAQNLAVLLSALTEFYTKYWLMERGRFADVMEYAQSRDDRFVEEAALVIGTITKNSPTILELLFGSTTAAVAIKLALDAIIQTPLRYRSTHLANEKKALALKLEEQQAGRVQKKEEQKTELEKQRDLLELEKQKVELEKQVLDLQRQQFELQFLHRDYAVKIAEELVNVARPAADQATKTVLAQAFVPHLLQLRNVKGLEVAEPGSGEGEEKQQLDNGVI